MSIGNHVAQSRIGKTAPVNICDSNALDFSRHMTAKKRNAHLIPSKPSLPAPICETWSHANSINRKATTLEFPGAVVPHANSAAS